jgi:hypothetical protein
MSVPAFPADSESWVNVATKKMPAIVQAVTESANRRSGTTVAGRRGRMGALFLRRFTVRAPGKGMPPMSVAFTYSGSSNVMFGFRSGTIAPIDERKLSAGSLPSGKRPRMRR